jgi:hypothetical protein
VCPLNPQGNSPDKDFTRSNGNGDFLFSLRSLMQAIIEGEESSVEEKISDSVAHQSRGINDKTFRNAWSDRYTQSSMIV